MRNPIRFSSGLEIMVTVILIIGATLLCKIVPGIKVMFYSLEGNLSLYEGSLLLSIIIVIITLTAVLSAYLIDKKKPFK